MSDGHGRSTGGFGITREQSVELIVRTCLENGVTNSRQIAYILATAQHETRNFTAPEEDFGRSQARKLGYRGGEEYFGRGYVHLTHKDNYEAMDRRLGLDGALVRDPRLATDPDIAARALVIGMRDGMFTGRRLDRYIDADSADFFNARRTVNGIVDRLPWSVKAAEECERFAREWERRMPALLETARGQRPSSPAEQSRDRGSGTPDDRVAHGERGPQVESLQRRLNALGFRDARGQALVEDGTFGRRTLEAAVAFQRAKGLTANGIVGNDTLAALANEERARSRAHPQEMPAPAAGARASILSEAERHFISGGTEYEYGRSDISRRNDKGNGLTDPSRDGRDLDGDGLRGIDCSAFVWRGLRNAGYAVPATPFVTRTLFEGDEATSYARRNFDVIPGTQARRDSGTLEPGDILLFRDRQSGGQHVGIFKNYDAGGRIRFIGSQVGTGPAEAAAAEGTYWNGGRFEIVGALRAKPEFQVRAPLHATPASGADEESRSAAPLSQAPQEPGPPRASADADRYLRHGERGPAITDLQRRLADLGYHGKDGKPLTVNGDFGDDTEFAVRQFQRDHGLQGPGVAGPKTAIALDRAEGALMSHPCNAHHALYLQVLEKVHAEERTRGLSSGHHSQRIAAALAVECLREGITRVDRVEFSQDVNLARAVQVSAVRDEPGLNRSTDGISTAQAAQQTLLESTEQIRQVAVNVQAQQREEQHRAMEQQPARAQPALP